MRCVHACGRARSTSRSPISASSTHSNHSQTDCFYCATSSQRLNTPPITGTYLLEVSVLVERHAVLEPVSLSYLLPVLDEYSHRGVDVKRVDHRHPPETLRCGDTCRYMAHQTKIIRYRRAGGRAGGGGGSRPRLDVCGRTAGRHRAPSTTCTKTPLTVLWVLRNTAV